MSELKPCPFCGEHLKSDGPDSDYYTHSKNDCHFSEWEFPCMSGDNLEAWNRRAQPSDKLDAEQAEAAFLEHWLTFAAEPVGAECCGEGVTGAEYMGQRETVCCGSPIPVERGAEEVIQAMRKRHSELMGILCASSHKEGGHGR